MEIVDNCPDSKDKWREAAARKNCTAYANQCDDPQRLDYHCVINTFVNVTLEVCAYGKTIHLGMKYIYIYIYFTDEIDINY